MRAGLTYTQFQLAGESRRRRNSEMRHLTTLAHGVSSYLFGAELSWSPLKAGLLMEHPLSQCAAYSVAVSLLRQGESAGAPNANEPRVIGGATVPEAGT